MRTKTENKGKMERIFVNTMADADIPRINIPLSRHWSNKKTEKERTFSQGEKVHQT